MSIVSRAKLASAAFAVVMLAGCGTSRTTGGGAVTPEPAPPMGQACAVTITGVMRDSLTNAPVARGLVLLETGAPQPELVPGADTRMVEFSEAARAASGADGAFRLCAPGPVSAPAVVVFAAIHGAGRSMRRWCRAR